MSPTPISFSQKIVNEVAVAVTEIFETKILANTPIQQRTQVWADAMVELTDQLVRRNVIHVNKKIEVVPEHCPIS